MLSVSISQTVAAMCITPESQADVQTKEKGTKKPQPAGGTHHQRKEQIRTTHRLDKDSSEAGENQPHPSKGEWAPLKNTTEGKKALSKGPGEKKKIISTVIQTNKTNPKKTTYERTPGEK